MRTATMTRTPVTRMTRMTGARGTKAAAKGKGGGADDGEEEDTKAFSRSRASSRYKSDLAFLGSESESD